MPSSKVPLRLQDIIENAQSALSYTEGMDLTAFQQNRMAYDAVERCLERICEAAAKLGDVATELMPGQPWQKVRSLGNVLRHEYDGIEEDRLFDVVRKELPSLLATEHRAD